MNITADSNEEILKLSDSELSDRLVEFGFTRTPVTNMTRKYLEKQLLTRINQSRGRWKVEEIDENLLSDVQKNNQELSDEKYRAKDAFNMNSTLYYAVFCPNENPFSETRIFLQQEEALQFARKNKMSRFKSFKNYNEASEFALHGVYPNGTINSPTSIQGCIPAISDGVSRFKGPKSQDLVLLRKVIESGDVSEVRRMVWENPRYLVGSGDTPSILQEGARYNALHVAAKVMHSEMTALLLETVSDVRFIQLLYGVEIEENCRQRAKFLLDLYLNTPDKGVHDTPLHIAVKYGAVKVVEVLVSYPECNKNRRNKLSKTPQEVVCERMKDPSRTVREEIEQLLKDAYFVPALRSVDAVLQPVIGNAFSTNVPLITNSDPLSPKMDVSAYAGPMDREQAENFRRRWKTPPRVKTVQSFTVARLCDLDRGLEREGRELARQYNIKWREYWPFLGIFTDFSTSEGILKLDLYLKDKFEKMSLEVAAKMSQSEQALTTPPRKNGHEKEGHSRENNQVLSPMSDLCVALTACSLSDKSPLDDAVGLSAKRSQAQPPFQQDLTTSLSPILYIEKTCQVLARRLADGILYVLHASEDKMCLSKNLKDILHIEVLNMQKLIISFRSNSCFSKINFQLIHSRISMLVPYILDDLTQSYDLMRICASLQVLASASPQDASSDEDDKSANNYRERPRAAPLRLGEQVSCLAQLVIHALNRPGGQALAPASKETEVEAMWVRCTECSCKWSASPPMTRAMRKGSSLKRGLAKFNDVTGNRLWSRQDAEQVVQRMPIEDVDEDQSETSETEETKGEDDCFSVEDDLDAFYTPPSSVASEAADLEEFESPEEGFPVFLDGKLPTKLDTDVLRALDQDLLTKEKHPHVWRWRHELLLFSEQERECWPSPSGQLRKDNLSPVSLGPQSPIRSPLTHRKPENLQQMWGSSEPPFSSPKRRLNL